MRKREWIGTYTANAYRVIRCSVFATVVRRLTARVCTQRLLFEAIGGLRVSKPVAVLIGSVPALFAVKMNKDY